MREPRISLAAFTELVTIHQAGLQAFLRGFLETREQAHDLTQDTFHAAWRAARIGTPPFIPEANDDEIRRWLFSIAYRRAIDHLRRRKLIRWEPLDIVEESAIGSRLPDFEDAIAEAEALRAALAALAPSDVACLLLRVAHGFSAAEVAAIVGATPEVVTKRLSRAKQRLRAAYLAQNSVAEEQIHER